MNTLSRTHLITAFLPATLAGCAADAGEDVVLDSPVQAAAWVKAKGDVRTGYPDVSHWTTEQVRAAIDGGEVVIVDVRRPAEYAVSHLPGAIHVPSTLSDPELFERIPSGGPVIVYCSIGMRSGHVAKRLSATRDDVHNYIGSIFEWANEGLPLESDAGPTNVVHTFSKSWAELVRPEYRHR